MKEYTVKYTNGGQTFETTVTANNIEEAIEYFLFASEELGEENVIVSVEFNQYHTF